MRAIAFEKYEGLGNDFVLFEAQREAEVDTAAAQALCDRRFGVGADGVLLLLPSTTADARMRVVNADGSVPEMCGNGLRCLALHVARKRGLARAELTIETDAGLRRCAIEDERGEGMLTVDMGVVRVVGEETIDVDGASFTLTLCDAGNPHAIAFRAIAPDELARFGPALATHRRFAQGTNVEFVTRDGPRAIDVVVWERGVGPTLACGTGACASLAAACVKGLAPYDVPVRVRLPGGTLEITVEGATGRVTLRGPARHVFSGRTT